MRLCWKHHLNELLPLGLSRLSWILPCLILRIEIRPPGNSTTWYGLTKHQITIKMSNFDQHVRACIDNSRGNYEYEHSQTAFSVLASSRSAEISELWNFCFHMHYKHLKQSEQANLIQNNHLCTQIQTNHMYNQSSTTNIRRNWLTKTDNCFPDIDSKNLFHLAVSHPLQNHISAPLTGFLHFHPFKLIIIYLQH